MVAALQTIYTNVLYDFAASPLDKLILLNPLPRSLEGSVYSV